MKVLKWVLIVLVVLVLLAVGFLAYLGMFSTLKTTETKMGPYTIAYESFTGPYSQTPTVFTKVYAALKKEGIQGTLGLGIYYDDPSKVSADKLRSDCGVVIGQAEMAKFRLVARKFKVKKIAQANCVITEFPIRNAISYMIGPMKAYAPLTKHAQAKGYKIARTYEIYDEAQKKITFVFEIAK